jgi:predicted ATPase
MHLKNVTFLPEQYPTKEHYPFNQLIFHHTKRVVFSSPVTLFVGENGTGKSTLLQAISRRCGIHIWQGIERTRFEVNPYETALYKHITVEWTDGKVPGSFFASDLFKNFTQLLDEWAADDPGMLKYFGGHSLMTQSHGQSLMSFFRTRYRIKGLYLLDEPETALSPKTQVGLLNILQEMSQAGHAQFIIATHSPILLACPGAEIYSFDTIPITQIEYEETEHYQIYKNFMEDRKQYIEGRST